MSNSQNKIIRNPITHLHGHGHGHGHNYCEPSQENKEFIAIPGGFICDGERFILSVIKDGEELPITKVIYDICKALENNGTPVNPQTYENTSFELENGVLTITDSVGSFSVSLQFLIDAINNLNDAQSASNQRIGILEAKCEVLVNSVAELEECVKDLEEI